MKRLLLAGLAASLLAASCGDAPEFPEPVPCTAPSPVPTIPERNPSSPYFNTVRVSVDRIATLREQLRSAYPGDKFSRTSEFRLYFATYADNTICAAEALRDLKPTGANFEAYDRDLDAALDALITHTSAGREAIRKRNVSEYRDWYREVDLKIDAVKAASNATRSR